MVDTKMCPHCQEQSASSAAFCSNKSCGKMFERKPVSTGISAAQNTSTVQHLPQQHQYNPYPQSDMQQSSANTGNVNDGPKKFSPKTRATFAVLAVCAAAVVAFFFIGGWLNDPQRLADDYLAALNRGDYVRVFNLLGLEESEFITPEALGNYNAANLGVLEFYATPMRTGRTRLIFFNEYQLITPDIIASNATVRVLSGASVSFEGRELTGNPATEEGYDIWQLPEVFEGEARFSVEHPFAEVWEDVVFISSGWETELGPLHMSESLARDLAQRSEEYTQAIIDGALAQRPFEDLGLAVTSDNSDVGFIRSSYDWLREEANPNNPFAYISNIAVHSTEFEYERMRLRQPFSHQCTVVVRADVTQQLVDWEASTTPNIFSLTFWWTYEGNGWVVESIAISSFAVDWSR